MSGERKDDGSIRDGVLFMLSLLLALFIGYWFRDTGHVVQIVSKPAPMPQNRGLYQP